MKRIATLGVAALILTAMAPATALAGAAVCTTGIATYGRMANGANFDPPRTYNAEKRARDKAIAAWRADVAAQCPHHSNLWWRAKNKSVSCDGYAGGTGCDLKGTPAKKLYRS